MCNCKTQSEPIAELAKALAKVQGSIRGYREDSENPYFKSKYGDLSSVWAAVREALSANGLSVVQTGEPAAPGYVAVKTTLLHSSGEWISGVVTLRPVKDDPQGAGSAITYARRYSLAAIVGVAPEDDDAETATHPKTQPKQNPQQKADAETVDVGKLWAWALDHGMTQQEWDEQFVKPAGIRQDDKRTHTAARVGQLREAVKKWWATKKEEGKENEAA